MTDSPRYTARKTRVSLEHVDAAINSVEPVVGVPCLGRFEKERSVDSESWFSMRQRARASAKIFRALQSSALASVD